MGFIERAHRHVLPAAASVAPVLIATEAVMQPSSYWFNAILHFPPSNLMWSETDQDLMYFRVFPVQYLSQQHQLESLVSTLAK